VWSDEQSADYDGALLLLPCVCVCVDKDAVADNGTAPHHTAVIHCRSRCGQYAMRSRTLLRHARARLDTKNSDVSSPL